MTTNNDNTSAKPQPAMPLAVTNAGEEVVLAGINGGDRLVHRLAEMGLIPGARFKVISKGQPGPFIILVKDTRLVLGRGMIHAVTVRMPS